MSIIIKGFDMPKEEINITITKDGRIYLDNKYHMIAEAIQIPKGHGRLIDESQAWSKVEKRKDGHSVITFNAPTILEAEEKYDLGTI